MTLFAPLGTDPLPSEATPENRRVTWRLPSAAKSPQKARRQVAAQLLDWRLPHLIDDATLIVSELVTNAVYHGAAPIWHTMRYIYGGAVSGVRVEVGDHGSGWSGIPARCREADSMKVGGRGLPLVEALSAEWGAWRLPHGLVVWAVLPVEACPQAGPSD